MNEASKIVPMRGKLLATRYRRPEHYPGKAQLIVPESWRETGELSLMELVRMGEPALDARGRPQEAPADIPEGSILIIADGSATYIGEHDGRDLFVVPQEAVRSVRWRTW
jgi:hypothetical protein